MYYWAVITPPYSGILYWRLDDRDWIPLRDAASGREFRISETTEPDPISWDSDFWAGFGCVLAGLHFLYLQLRSETVGKSNAIVSSFSLGSDYGCTTATKVHSDLPPRNISVLPRVPDVARVTLTLTSTGGVFPDLTMGWSANVSGGYSGFLRWRLDNSDWIADRSIDSDENGTVRWNDSSLSEHCLRARPHFLFLQVQSDAYGDSFVISRDFTLEWDYGCGPAAGLIRSRTHGSFPYFWIYIRAVITQPYSGILYWRLDDREWIPIGNMASGEEPPISQTTEPDRSVRLEPNDWAGLGCIRARPEPQAHSLDLQIQSETLKGSNVITWSFQTYNDVNCTTGSSSPSVHGSGSWTWLLNGRMVVTVVAIAVVPIAYVCYLKWTAPVRQGTPAGNPAVPQNALPLGAQPGQAPNAGPADPPRPPGPGVQRRGAGFRE
jgi:hypothetical protein